MKSPNSAQDEHQATPRTVEEQARTRIQEEFARTLFVVTLADTAEEVGYPGISGADWFNLVTTETPEPAMRAADYLIRKLEHENQCTVVDLLRRALGANPDDDKTELLKKFGHYIPMEAMGHGVSWTDSQEPFQITYPTYFSAGDLILIGQDALKQLPLFDQTDIEEGKLAEQPETTCWGFNNDYEPPIAGYDYSAASQSTP
ncbi:TPA: hypothetical protein ACGJRU_003090 [Pseudomonas aeruginosa]|uniref:hypothetical protein n=1 Tax=Pseudomonas aeruginosa TaxID=287 RepID=UPI0005F20D32|nr:hypothetical protein [Pseudomonas aeruginosa]KJS27582.1 MAG: hypothetical protein VR76_09070 [Pseudomonas sp. BRH_c35]EMA2595342.1 hypothetical protein [Pseudomonas aeruginosa]MBZ3677528.1 hypothetical protein [Pseudomonas aeruginosa]MBZ3688523.1 hypothetical protein [Pseudomonas aeruginosa]MDS9629012.1 hypothetical protein [Pseudomonas aeruginosa]